MRYPGVFKRSCDNFFCPVGAVSLCLIAAGCSSEQSAPPAPASISIERLEPNSTAEAKAFHARPDGQSVLVVFGTSIPSGASVLWNDQPMASSGGGSAGFVQAVIPGNLVQKAGTAKITVRSGETVSNPLDFTVFGTTGPAPAISSIDPAGTVAGKGFHAQPSGDSALGIVGTDFLPGVSVLVDGQKINTVYRQPLYFISAQLPASHIVRQAAPHQIWVVNPDGKTSNKVAFNVAAQ